MQKVLLVPHAHDIYTVLHRDIVELLQKAPPSTRIALEYPPSETRKQLQKINDPHYWEKTIFGDFLEEPRRTEATFQEVLGECETRGLEVVSIESKKILRKLERMETRNFASKIKQRQARLAIDAEREEYLATSILRILAKDRRPLIVILGTTHVLSVLQMLRQKGCLAQLHIPNPRNEKKILRIMGLYEGYKKAIREGNERERIQIGQRLNREITTLPRYPTDFAPRIIPLHFVLKNEERIRKKTNRPTKSRNQIRARVRK